MYFLKYASIESYFRITYFRKAFGVPCSVILKQRRIKSKHKNSIVIEKFLTEILKTGLTTMADHSSAYFKI